VNGYSLTSSRESTAVAVRLVFMAHSNPPHCNRVSDQQRRSLRSWRLPSAG
jgi:hypothetical protein